MRPCWTRRSCSKDWRTTYKGQRPTALTTCLTPVELLDPTGGQCAQRQESPPVPEGAEGFLSNLISWNSGRMRCQLTTEFGADPEVIRYYPAGNPLACAVAGVMVNAENAAPPAVQVVAVEFLETA